MMSKKLARLTRTPVAALFFSILKRGLWLPLAHTVLNIVIASFTSINYRFRDSYDLYGSGDGFYGRLLSCLDESFPIFAVSVIISALVGCTAFSYVNRVSSACFIHGLPVSREKIFFAHYLAGAAMVMIPGIAASVVVGAYYGSLVISLLFLYTYALYCIGVMSFAILVCQFSANTLGGLIFTAFGLTSPLICEGFVMYLMETSLYGYAGNYGGFIVCSNLYLAPDVVPTFKGLIYLFATAVFIVIALILFKRRAIELAGDLIAFAGIRKVAVYICGILAGMCAYLVFSASLLMFLLFGVICAVLVNFAVRKRFTLKGAVTPVLTVMLTTLLIFAVYRYDLTGFEKRIPALDNIESARVYYRYDDYNMATINDKRVEYVDFHRPIRDEEGIEKVRALHKDLLGNESYYSTIEKSRSYNIEYTLKNGKTLKRNYMVYYERNAETFSAVSSLYEFKRHNHEILEESLTLLSATVSGAYGKTVLLEGADAVKLYDAYVSDLMSTPYALDHDLHTFASSKYMTIDFKYFFNNAVYNDGTRVDPASLALLPRSEEAQISPCFVNTLAVINELSPALTDFGEEIPEGSFVTIEYYTTTTENGLYNITDKYGTEEIKDPTAIKELILESVRLSDVRAEENAKRYYLRFKIGEASYFNVTITGENETVEKYIGDDNQIKEYVNLNFDNGNSFTVNAAAVPETVDTEVY